MIISIIIATYNAEKTLKQCLDSIIPQLTNECELLIIDGDSKDNTSQIIHLYKDIISYTISEPDNGIYDAWNKGVKVAKGNWIMFIGADDILLPNALNQYLNIIRQTDNIDLYDYICAHNQHIDQKGNILKIIGGNPQWNIFRKRMNVAHVASLHNKCNLFGQIGYYDLSYKICADYELLMRKKDKLRAVYLPIQIAQMQVGGMSFSTKAIVETYKIRKQHHSVSGLYNNVLFLLDWIAFKLFILRKSLMGYKIN